MNKSSKYTNSIYYTKTAQNFLTKEIIYPFFILNTYIVVIYLRTEKMNFRHPYHTNFCIFFSTTANMAYKYVPTFSSLIICLNLFMSCCRFKVRSPITYMLSRIKISVLFDEFHYALGEKRTCFIGKFKISSTRTI